MKRSKAVLIEIIGMLVIVIPMITDAVFVAVPREILILCALIALVLLAISVPVVQKADMLSEAIKRQKNVTKQ